MRRSDIGKWRSKAISCASIFALSISGFGPSAQAQTDSNRAVNRIPTATPIKHVIIIVGENRSFDHLLATYEPKNKSEKVLNLLSERIINKDGTPGQEFAKATPRAVRLPSASAIRRSSAITRCRTVVNESSSTIPTSRRRRDPTTASTLRAT
jgi:phospholipase C